MWVEYLSVQFTSFSPINWGHHHHLFKQVFIYAMSSLVCSSLSLPMELSASLFIALSIAMTVVNGNSGKHT